MVGIYRLGVYVPTPGINVERLRDLISGGTVFQIVNLFSGGALDQFSIFALGIMPYVSASIIFSLLAASIPTLKKIQEEGESGRQKINQWTRYGTVVLSIIQGFGISYGLYNQGMVLTNVSEFKFIITTMVTLAAGTSFIMWLGEQITESGIGNGISLIIFAGIVDRLPSAVKNIFDMIRTHEMSLFTGVLILGMVFAIMAIVVWVETGQRKIPVQYAKRVVGRKMYGGSSTFLPIKVDQSGVIAVIFAISLLSTPLTVAQFFPNAVWAKTISDLWNRASLAYELVYASLIIFFCYFYNSVSFNPKELAENMKKWGGFIPGLRPGEPTAEYIQKVLERVTLGGAVFVAAIAVLPDYMRHFMNAPFFFGGTSLLIVVGVALDTIGQIESHLIMRHYEGFMKDGRIKGRWFNIK